MGKRYFENAARHGFIAQPHVFKTWSFFVSVRRSNKKPKVIFLKPVAELFLTLTRFRHANEEQPFMQCAALVTSGSNRPLAAQCTKVGFADFSDLRQLLTQRAKSSDL